MARSSVVVIAILTPLAALLVVVTLVFTTTAIVTITIAVRVQHAIDFAAYVVDPLDWLRRAK
jgi:hypothetical protein